MLINQEIIQELLTEFDGSMVDEKAILNDRAVFRAQDDSKKWKYEIIRKRGNKCECCGLTRNEIARKAIDLQLDDINRFLQIHHKTAKVGYSNTDDLEPHVEVLCRPCHLINRHRPNFAKKYEDLDFWHLIDFIPGPTSSKVYYK